ncbi:hypothetical protein K8I61_17235 [bacterium]|nr:hypothetical protein [bacterium]
MPNRIKADDDFSDTMDHITDHVFPPHPVHDDPRYFQSLIMDVRRELIDGQHARFCQDLSERDISTAVDVTSLGPYERHTVATILQSPGPLVAIVGGAGAGKTSSIRYIIKHIIKGERRNRKNQEHHRALPYIMLDFNKADFKQKMKTLDGDGTGQEKYIVRYFAKQLESEIIANIDAESLAEILIFAINLNRRSIDEGGFESKYQQLNDYAQEAKGVSNIDRLLKNGKINHDLLLAWCRSFTSADRLIFWLAVLDSINRDKERNSFKTVLLIDNIDPLQEYLQQHIIALLLPISQYLTFQILVPVRLTNFETNVASHPFFYYCHSGAMPTDIAVRRLSRFLLDPSSYDAYQTIIESDVRATMYARLFELWLRLQSRDDDFRNIFEALCGTDIRNAMYISQAWAKSQIINRDYAYLEGGSEDVQASLSTTIAFTAISESIYYSSMFVNKYSKDNGVISLVNGRGEEEAQTPIGEFFAKKIVDAWCTMFMSVSQHHGAKSGAMLNDIYRKIPAVVELYSKQEDYYNFLSQAVAIAVRRNKKASRSNEFSVEVINSIIKTVTNTVSTSLQSIGVPTEITEVVKNFLIGSIEKGREFGFGDRIGRPPLRRDHVKDPEIANTKIVQQLLRVNNRFDAARALLVTEPSGKSGDSGYAANVFSYDGKQLMPMGLRILYLLSEISSNKMRVALFYDEMYRHFTVSGRLNEEKFNTYLLLTINNMADKKRQVVWVDRRLSFESIAELMAHSNISNISLSITGVKYFQNLISHPVYMQTYLSRMPYIIDKYKSRYGAFDEGYIESRLRLALVGLNELFDEEYSRLCDIQRSSLADVYRMRCNELNCRCSATDLYVRSFNAFMESSTSHRATLTRKGDKYLPYVSVIDDLIVDWFSDLAGQIEKLKVMFESVPAKWLEEIEWVSSFVASHVPQLSDKIGISLQKIRGV